MLNSLGEKMTANTKLKGFLKSDQLDMAFTRLKEKNAMEESAMEELHRLQGQFDKLKDDIKEKSGEIERLKKESQKWRETHKTSLQKIEELEKEVDETKKEKNLILQQKEELSEKIKELSCHPSHSSREHEELLKAELERKENNLRQAQLHLAKKVKEVTELSQRAENSEGVVLVMKDEIKRFDKKIEEALEELAKEKEAHQRTKRRLEEGEEKYLALREQHLQLQSLFTSMKSFIDGSKAQSE